MSAQHTQPPARAEWGAVIALEAALSMLLGLVIVFLWGVTGGGYFWPAWVVFALLMPAWSP